MKRLWAPWRIKFILEHREMKGCVLCELPKGDDDAAALVVGRSTHSYCLLNKYPYNSGHLMIVPYAHTNQLGDLDEAALLDIHKCVRDAIEILDEALSPHGHNVGMNLGEAGGAGIREHLHYHIVPRWNGDTNYIPVVGETKVLPESLDDTYARLAPLFRKRWAGT